MTATRPWQEQVQFKPLQLPLSHCASEVEMTCIVLSSCAMLCCSTLTGCPAHDAITAWVGATVARAEAPAANCSRRPTNTSDRMRPTKFIRFVLNTFGQNMQLPETGDRCFG